MSPVNEVDLDVPPKLRQVHDPAISRSNPNQWLAFVGTAPRSFLRTRLIPELWALIIQSACPFLDDSLDQRLI